MLLVLMLNYTQLILSYHNSGQLHTNNIINNDDKLPRNDVVNNNVKLNKNLTTIKLKNYYVINNDIQPQKPFIKTHSFHSFI